MLSSIGAVGELYILTTCVIILWFLVKQAVKGKNGPNSVGQSTRGWGWTVITWIVEFPGRFVASVEAVPVLMLALGLAPRDLLSAILLIALPAWGFILSLLCFVADSWVKDWDNLERDMEISNRLLVFKDKAFEKRWGTQKIPIDIAFDAFFMQQLDFKDIYEVVQNRYQLFRFVFTFTHAKSFLKDIIGKAVGHDHSADISDVAGVYNRGNDFYNWFMGTTMLYSCALYEDVKESLEVAQARKLKAICDMAQIKEGMDHLDMGCGWGTLLAHVGKYCKTNSLGVTLSEEQAKYCRARIKASDCEQYAKVQVINFWDLPPEKKFDRITCLEMSEHIGIKNYQKFLHAVRNLLKDDGIFYLQIAGLRRAWQYEDLVWGLFMGRYIFPGADASCPLGWDITQVERAGFEVHRVHNTGCHYALTIKNWYDRWIENRKDVTAKYGEWWFRMWSIFLSWSACIAFQGSSTCWMITLRKQTRNDKWSVTIPHGEQPMMSRVGMSVGPQKVGIIECERDPYNARKQVFDLHGSGLEDKSLLLDNDNIDDEVRAPEDEKTTVKDYACIAGSLLFAVSCVASVIGALGANKELPNPLVIFVVLFLVSGLRWLFVFMMRPVLFPIIKQGRQPSRRVMRLGDNLFFFLYYLAMAVLSYTLLAETKYLPAALGGKGSIATALSSIGKATTPQIKTVFNIQLGFMLQGFLQGALKQGITDHRFEMMLYNAAGAALLLNAYIDDMAYLGLVVLFVQFAGDVVINLFLALAESVAKGPALIVFVASLAVTFYTRLFFMPFRFLPAMTELSGVTTATPLGFGFFRVMLVALSVGHLYRFAHLGLAGLKVIAGEQKVTIKND